MSEANLGEMHCERKSLPDYLRTHFSDTQRYVIIWAITGLSCGFVAVLFHLCIDGMFHLIRELALNLGGEAGSIGFLMVIGLAPVLGGLLSGILVHFFAPSAAGSGIPQTKAAYYRKFGLMRLRTAVFRFIAGVLSIGMGMSLGREGPTVHICSSLASWIGQVFGLAKKRIQAMVPLGMGAGISAAFNTPMAAVFFVFEELLDDFSSKSFFGIFMAVVIAAVVQRIMIGGHAAFDIGIPDVTTNPWMLMAIPLGLMCGLFGKRFIDGILWSRNYFRTKVIIPIWMRPALGGLCVGIIGVVIFQITSGHDGVFGIGYRDLDLALNGQMTALGLVLLLLLGKVVATILAYGSGASGGLFAPTLFIGGMLGASLGILGQPLFDYDSNVIGAMALLGMGSFFAAVIRCPMTSIVIIWEMTGFYSLILPLMVGNMIAYLISSKLQPVSLYDSLLLQDKISLRKLPRYRGDQDWRNLPISSVMTFDPIVLRSDLSVGENFKIIEDNHWRHHAYPVLDETEKLVGILTHQELSEQYRKVGKSEKGFLEIPEKKLITVMPETSIRDAAQILVIEDVMQAPVVSSKNTKKLVGIITLHDIARQQNAIDETIGRD